jgi:hypothetical protein
VIHDPRQALPEGWAADTTRGFGPFTTELTMVGRDGLRAVWNSRHHRKRSTSPDGSTWWAPHALGWWMGVLFAIGSACFALAAVPSFASRVGVTTDNTVFFVGSIFFTTAGLLQYGQVVGADDPALSGAGSRLRRLASWSPHRIDWLAAAVQSIGTVFFNISTGHALTTSATSVHHLNHAIWRPDALGSICFLVSSYLSFAEVCHGSLRWLPRDLSWWITSGNLAGSVAFGVSAVASKFVASGAHHGRRCRRVGRRRGTGRVVPAGLNSAPATPEPVDSPTVHGVVHTLRGGGCLAITGWTCLAQGEARTGRWLLHCARQQLRAHGHRSAVTRGLTER